MLFHLQSMLVNSGDVMKLDGPVSSYAGPVRICRNRALDLETRKLVIT